MASQRFQDRLEAGTRLGVELSGRGVPDAVVLGLPRGGVPVAAAVARALGAPLDVIVVRKLGVPQQPELAMGAVGEDGVLVVNHDVVRATGVSESELRRVEREERGALDRRLVRLRAVHRRVPLAGRTAILVDDGIATGATMRAAIGVARAHGARTVVVAVPVAPPDVVAVMESEADSVVVLEQPDEFWAVGSWYENFETVTDDEVIALPGSSGDPGPFERELVIGAGSECLLADLVVPAGASGIVVFAHGSGSSRRSPRNRWVAGELQRAGLATLLMDLLSESEARLRDNVFDVGLLASRLGHALEVLAELPETRALPVGLFGASTGAAAALCAAAAPGARVAAVVSRGGRPDLAEDRLEQVVAPTLFIVGGDDGIVITLNEEAAARLRCTHEVVVVPGASHLFEEPGTLERVAAESIRWFTKWFVHPRP